MASVAKSVDFLVLMYSYLYADHVTCLWMLVDIVLCAFFSHFLVFPLSLDSMTLNCKLASNKLFFKRKKHTV